MKENRIIHAAGKIGVTYLRPQQSTILKMNTGESIYVFFKTLAPVEGNKWAFTKFNGSEELIIDGDKIRSISLEENDKVIYHCTEEDEIDHLHLSVHK
jgi:hypothetical protein